MSRRKSAMTIRVYRVTGSGERIELARDEVCLGEPYFREITLAWPDCACRRCMSGIFSAKSLDTTGLQCKP